jgi:hypothetical protein
LDIIPIWTRRQEDAKGIHAGQQTDAMNSREYEKRRNWACVPAAATRRACVALPPPGRCLRVSQDHVIGLRAYFSDPSPPAVSTTARLRQRLSVLFSVRTGSYSSSQSHGGYERVVQWTLPRMSMYMRTSRRGNGDGCWTADVENENKNTWRAASVGQREIYIYHVAVSGQKNSILYLGRDVRNGR